MKIKLSLLKYLLLALLTLFAIGCEDAIPTDYDPVIFVEAYLIVDEPVEGITITMSQPIGANFSYDSSFVTDAKVRISGDNMEMILDYRPVGKPNAGYYYSDTSYKVKPETAYNLEIITSEGSVIRGKTVTPQRFTWAEPPNRVLYYPKDTLNLPAEDSLKLSWTSSNTALGIYGVSIMPLDTAGYGEYLLDEQDLPNRRIMMPWLDDKNFIELTRWTIVPNTEWPLVWRSFKWFGWQEISVWSFDFNMLRWYLQNGARGNIDPLLTSVEGEAWGVFGSASKISETFFLVDHKLHKFPPDLNKEPK